MRYAPEKAQPYLFHQVMQLFKTMLLIAFILMVSRLIFVSQYSELVVLKKNLDLTFRSFLLGLRYDLICAAYILAIPYIVTCVGFIFPRDGYLRFIPWFHRIWIFFFICILLLISLADLSFYSYFQDHLNVIFLTLLESDTQTLLSSIHKKNNLFVWIPGLMVFLGFIGWILCRWFKRERIDLFYAQPLAKEELSLVLTAGVVILVFLGRGNLARMPLSIEDSYISDLESINELSVNGVIALNRSVRIKRTTRSEDQRYLSLEGYQQLTPAVTDLMSYRGRTPPSEGWTGLENLKMTTALNETVKSAPPHVIVMVVRNLATMWWDFNLPVVEDFKVHTTEDFFFSNFLASESGTIGSIDALTSGLPLRPGARFLSESQYMRTQIASGSHLPYKNAGYTTRFVYGGKLGWRQLGGYLQVQGWDRLEGADQISRELDLYQVKESDRESDLGVYDEHLFEYVQKELSRATTPQFFFIITTTSQPPFDLPTSFKPKGLNRLGQGDQKKFGRSTSEVLGLAKSLQYSTQKLSAFLTQVKSNEQTKNSVIAVTGDHSFWVGRSKGRENLAQKLGVPFYLHLPEALRPKEWDKDNWGSHVDVMPTLYELTLSESSYWGFGQSMFRPRGAALNAHNIVMNNEGAWVGENPYCWKDAQSKTLERCQPSEALLTLRQFKKAAIGLTDEFLRSQASGQIGLLP
ncbi:MAG: LTA synthase family protein [Bacteriovoracia bacterium]